MLILGESDPPLSGPYKNTNTTCKESGKCTCWIPDVKDDESCHGAKCNIDGNDGLCSATPTSGR